MDGLLQTLDQDLGTVLSEFLPLFPESAKGL